MSADMFTDIKQFEQRLGLPEGFYERLIREDDWSFVIKLHALLEAACAHILATRLHAPELEQSLAYLDLANSKCGKVVLLRELGAITADQATILRRLAELRNALVHNITKVAFSFPAYVASRDKQQLDHFITSFGHGVADTVHIGQQVVSRKEFVQSNPKLALWLTAAEVLACLHLEMENAQLRLERLALAKYANLTGQST
jgi:hypothetical protein